MRPEQRKSSKGWDWAVKVKTLAFDLIWADRDGFEVKQALFKKTILGILWVKFPQNYIVHQNQIMTLACKFRQLFLAIIIKVMSQSQLQRRRSEGTLTVDPLHTVNIVSSPGMEDLKGIGICLIHVFVSKAQHYFN